MIRFFEKQWALVLSVVLTALIVTPALVFNPSESTEETDGNMQKVTVFAAASTRLAMEHAILAFERETNINVKANYAASSTLARQIVAGAPCDVYVSANLKWRDWLTERVEVNNQSVLFGNRMVLITPAGSDITLPDKSIPTYLAQTPLPLALGDPKHVPAGMYAAEILTNLGVAEQVLPRIKSANNVLAALKMVETGELPLGIVYSSAAGASDKVRTLQAFKSNLHTPIKYPLLLLNDNSYGAMFKRFLESEKGQSIFQSHGFITGNYLLDNYEQSTKAERDG